MTGAQETGSHQAGRPASHYTFGDNPTAGQRLALLAAAYRDATSAFLTAWAPQRPELAVDLGCGPGHTTRLLHDLLRPRVTVGLDASAEFLRQASAARPPGQPGIGFVRADVGSARLPVPPADLLHCRFLLTHLPEPAAVLRSWLAGAGPGGRVLVQETARLEGTEPQFGQYYALVAGLQRAHGQALEIGAQLADLARAAGLRVLHHGRRPLLLPAAVMARLHVLNLRTYRQEEVVRRQVPAAELDALDAWLEAVASGDLQAEPIRQELGELVLQAG